MVFSEIAHNGSPPPENFWGGRFRVRKHQHFCPPPPPRGCPSGRQGSRAVQRWRAVAIALGLDMKPASGAGDIEAGAEALTQAENRAAIDVLWLGQPYAKCEPCADASAGADAGAAAAV